MNIQVVPPQGSIQQSMLPANTTDDEFIELWLAGKSIATIDAYRRDIGQFRLFTDYKPLHSVTYADITSYASIIQQHYSHAASNRKLAAVKSLFSFAVFMHHFDLNIPSALRLKKPENRMARCKIRLSSRQDCGLKYGIRFC